MRTTLTVSTGGTAGNLGAFQELSGNEPFVPTKQTLRLSVCTASTVRSSPPMDAFAKQVIAAEAEATTIKYHNWNDRVRKREGSGNTVEGQAITHAYLARTTQMVQLHIDSIRNSTGYLKGLVPVVLQLPAEVLALYALQITLHTIGCAAGFTNACEVLGLALEEACFAHGITKANPKLAAKVTKAAKQRHSRVSTRRKAARKLASTAGFKVAKWTQMQRMAAGQWLMGLVTMALPEVFEIVGEREDKRLTISPEAADIALAAQSHCLERMKVHLPQPDAPKPWKRFEGGGLTRLVATHHKQTAASLRAACADHSIAPHLAGLNALQAVPWRINTRVLDVLLECKEFNIPVKGMPRKRVQLDPRPKKWPSDEDRKAWFDANNPRIKHNLAVISDEFMWAEDTKIAGMLRDHTFYTPMYCDFRGRVYAQCHFNFQRDDRVRAMFLFERGEPIGEEGLWWLKTHLANCAAQPTDAGKTDKLPLSGRVSWVDQNLTQIRAVSLDPLKNLWWTKADKPFLFLASIFELVSALDTGPSYVCHLPTSYDGACSGLQHLSAMTRAEKEAALVNLLPCSAPNDVYSAVAEISRKRIEQDANASDQEWIKQLAKQALTEVRNTKGEVIYGGITRKVVKRNVMTYSYSSSRFGMGQQQQEDLVDDLSSAVVTGELEAHPFTGFERPRWTKAGSGWQERPSLAAAYLAGHAHRAIEEVVEKPAQAMTFLQKLAKALAHEGKVLKWTTPSGFPWTNRYHKPVLEKLHMYMHDKGVRREHQTLVSTGHKAEVWKEKAASAVAPNFVHALDASHLMLTARACAHRGIQLATVHDSFGCLPSRAAEVNRIIRLEFVDMYKHNDVLGQVYEAAGKDIEVRDPQRWPSLPAYGELDINQVMEARYAFA